MKQLIIEADYHVNSHSCLLVNILCNGIRNEVVEYVEHSQPELLHFHSFACWEAALIHADQVLSEIAECKCSHNMLLVPASTLFVSCAAPTKVPMSSTSAMMPSVSQSSAKADVHLNQPGTFGGAGIPMDINKAHAEGKCAKCSGAWLCATHSRPHCDACFVKFKGAHIFYQNAEGLQEAIQLIEKGFGTRE